MTHTTIPKDETDLALYERQLNFVESMVEFHPDSLGIFNSEELRDFRNYFLPDWSKVEDYRAYYRQLRQSDLSLPARALALLTRYVDHHQVQNGKALLAP